VLTRRKMMRRRTCVLALVVGLSLAVDRQVASAEGAPWSSADLFDDGQLHTIALTVHPRDWEELRANYALNTYYPAHLEWRGARIENIGIRSRGTGSRSGGKPGLLVDFNRFDESQRFLGLTAVILRNNIQDASGLNERIAMKLFARLGMPAPREAHVRLYVNGDYAGLYTIVEPVDQGNGVFYFPVTGYAYIASLTKFYDGEGNGKHCDLQGFTETVVREERGSWSTAHTDTTGFILHCHDIAIDAQSVTKE